jgi:N-acetylated-alpha-linked acidic dipeptidase
MVMRMANADVLPQEFGDLSETVAGYITELKALRESVAKKIAETNASLAEGLYTATIDPRRPLMPPKADSAAPFLNFAPLENSATALNAAGARFEKAYASTIGAGVNATILAQLNALLRQTDDALLLPGGLPKRPWYLHSLYAPGFYTGYGVKTMPGVREAIEQKDWKQADTEIGRLAAALDRETALILRAAALLERKDIRP